MTATGPVRIKICGIRDASTALAAVEAGADALGFVFAPSKRQVDRETARSICSQMPPFVSLVGVFVDAPAAVVEETADYCGLDTLQLHGDESPEYCGAFKYKIIKAFRIKDAASLDGIKNYRCAAVLLDSFVPGVPGGTGHSLDWSIAREVTGSRVILAGGLNPGNVRKAIQVARPYAVDVSSGVETGGRKDIEKIRLFIKRAREVD